MSCFLIIFVTWNEVSIAECKKKEVEEIRFHRIRNVKEAGTVKQYIMIDDNYVDVHKLINAYAIDGYGIKRKIFKKVFHGIKYNLKDEFLVAKR